MDDPEDRIRAALRDLTTPDDANRVRETALGRVRGSSRPRWTENRARLRPVVAVVVSLAVVGAFTGAILTARGTPSALPSGSPSAQSTGRLESAEPYQAELPSIHWTGVAIGAPERASIIKISVAQTVDGLIAAGTALDTSHHHNDADSEGHHLEAIVWTSPDGRSWHRLDRLPGFEHATLVAVQASGDQVLAVGSAAGAGGQYSPRIWRSTGAEGWSIVSPSGLPSGATFGSLRAMADGFLLAVSEPGRGYITPASLWRSADGVAWERVPFGGAEAVLAWSAFAVGSEFVAIGQRSLDSADPAPVLIRSVDGTNWDIVGLADLGFGPDLVGIDDIIAGGSGFIAAGRIIDRVSPQDPAASRLGPPTDGAIWTSPDLSTWTRVEPGRDLFGGTDDQEVRVIESVDGGYVALGTSAVHGREWLSADGASWHQVVTPDALAGASLRDAIALGSELVVVGIGAGGEPVAWLGSIANAQPNEIVDLDDLLAALNVAGSRVSIIDRFDPMPDVLGKDGSRICVDGQRVFVYAFGNEAEANALAASIDPQDPSQVGSSAIVEWAGEPRFWQSGSLVVLYLGPDPSVEHRLTTVLGPVIAKGGGRNTSPDGFAC